MTRDDPRGREAILTGIVRSPVWHLLLLVLAGALAYSNTFEAPFQLDDLESIAGNRSIQSIGNFLPGGSGYDFHPRRWVGYLSFALNYRLGGLDVTGYHLVNLLIHLFTGLLVYALVRLTFRTPRLAGSRIAARAPAAALLAALLFLLHPIQTQAVTYVVQRLTSLATLLYLLSLVFYASARLRQEAAVQPSRGGARFLLAGAALAAALAMQTKEIAFTLPFAAALYEASFFRGPWRRRAPALVPLLLTLPIIPLSVLAGGAAEIGRAGAEGTAPPTLHYLWTQFRVLATYLRLLLLPVGQNVDYDYPVYTTFFTAPVLASALLLAALLGAAVLLHRRSGEGTPALDPSLRLVSFGIFWFFLTLSVESSFVSIADVIFEHRLYLPLAGGAAGVAAAVVLASEKSATLPGGRTPLVAAGLIVVVLAVAAYRRNDVWGNNVLLWEDVVRKSPGKGRPWYNLGTYLADAGRPAEAIPVLSRAVALQPQNADAWHNLGRAHLMLGRAAEAVPLLSEAVRLNPGLENAVVNLAAALINANRPAEAVPLLETVRQRHPEWPELRLNLGLAYLGSGNLPGAREELSFLQRQAPHLARTLGSLIARAAIPPPR